MKAFFKALFIGLLVFGLSNVLAAAQSIQGIVPHEGTIQLEGFTRFAFYAAKEHLVITDGYTVNFLECKAELIFSDKQNFVLNTEEWVPGIMLLYRKLSIQGKMTPSGELKFTWPETWWELGETRSDILSQVRLHTGCQLSGQGINKDTLNYMGYFDGTNFFADMHILGDQVEPGTMPFFSVVMDGPIQINFIIDIENVD